MSEQTIDVERIADPELEYHAKLIERVRWAQQAQQEIHAVEAAFRAWGKHLHEKYGLSPGEGVDEHGVITRQSSRLDNPDDFDG